MSLLPRVCLAFLALLAVLAWGMPAAASDFQQYKDLRNEYLKVIDVRERVRTEERYVENDGKVTLQKLPFKEVLVTAELVQKPPSNMSTFLDSAKEPYFKLCLTPFDSANQALDKDCQAFRFQSLIKGNVGTASFRLTPEMARYELHLTQQVPNKGAPIKLWSPRD
ncbi:MAG: hypothetical protein AB7U59_00875 [Desulfovibrionaceae bacterium]|jgi:hypothetical protein